MNIGDKYAENKLYRGIKFSNGLPLVAEDLLEFSDTLANKNSYILDNLLGSGLINDIDFYYDNGPETSEQIHIYLRSPAILNIGGDICIVKNSDDTSLYSNARAEFISPNSEKVICIVGWYQHIYSDTTMREYGGVKNNRLPNDLVYGDPLNIQVSTRYQFRWDTAIADFDNNTGKISGKSLHIQMRDKDGELIKGYYDIYNINLESITSSDSIYTVESPTGMDYVENGKLYIIPLLKFRTNYPPIDGLPVRITEMSVVDIRKPKCNFIRSNTEPVGDYYEGTQWYNPETSEFKVYVKDLGFIANAPRMGFVQYQYTQIASSDTEISADLSYTMDFPLIMDDDIFEVTYEGLKLQESVDYIIDRANKTITLLNFTRVTGERFVVTLTRLMETSSSSTLTNLVNEHIRQGASTMNSGHVRLSDTEDVNLDVSTNVAATPRAVSESKILKDTANGNEYKLVVYDNVLYIENTSTNNRVPIINGLI